MEEIRPGLLHWTAFRDTIGQDVHSYLHAPSGTLIDPMEPLQGLDAVPPVERITVEHAGRVERLPWHHRDPFDRMLVAQAGIERGAIVSHDPALRPYGVPIVW